MPASAIVGTDAHPRYRMTLALAPARFLGKLGMTSLVEAGSFWHGL